MRTRVQLCLSRDKPAALAPDQQLTAPILMHTRHTPEPLPSPALHPSRSACRSSMRCVRRSSRTAGPPPRAAATSGRPRPPRGRPEGLRPAPSCHSVAGAAAAALGETGERGCSNENAREPGLQFRGVLGWRSNIPMLLPACSPAVCRGVRPFLHRAVFGACAGHGGASRGARRHQSSRADDYDDGYTNSDSDDDDVR